MTRQTPEWEDSHVTDYWIKHYATDHCTLCGNTGIIDTRNVKTPAAHPVGRLNWCICPNGQALRHYRGDEPSESYLKALLGIGDWP